MRFVLPLLLMLGLPAFAAGDRENDYAKRLTAENVEFLTQLAKRIKEAGFHDVQIIPQMFVVSVRGKDGRPTTLLVDYNTLKAVEVANADEFLEHARREQSEGELSKLH